ncbi:hypothetical protein GA0074694_6037 [Micromonospora inyonensis]|uniref:DUF7059 domain-containing protein n=1 Tax=Micromonospora inyonensis TaxID=47866 RepID=A0A1C6SPW8_9ACTN|nr:hypothetical protein GA0074694_6037 [Micromonospora inyonensis]
MLLSPTGIDRLRTALTSAGFTATGVAARLGPQATAAMGRNDYRAALRATEDRDRLGTLIRLFICEQTEPAAPVAAALAPLTVAEALDAGLVEPYGDGLRAGIDLEPYGDDWWMLADLPASARPGPRAGTRRGTGTTGHLPSTGASRREGTADRPPGPKAPPKKVPALVTAVPVPRRRATPPAGTAAGTGTRVDVSGDEELKKVLLDPKAVPRKPNGTVPVKVAAKVLGTGPDRARRLLDELNLREPKVPVPA